MMTVHAFEAVCYLLPYFALAAMFKAYEEPALIIGAVLLPVFISALILEKYKSLAVRFICGLLPMLGLLAAETRAQVLFTVPALLIWYVFAISGKNGINYEDYKYWFGLPALIVLLILLISVPRLPEYRTAALCASAYLAVGILVLRRKRMGAGAGTAAKLLNIAEPVGAGLCGILAGAALWEVLKRSGKLLEIIFYPIGLLIGAVISVLEWFTDILARHQPVEESTAWESVSESAADIIESEAAVPSTEAAAYAWAETLIRAVTYIFILALFVLIVSLVYKALKNSRTGAFAGDPEYDEAGGEKTFFGRNRRKKRSRVKRTNNEKIREIYREYLTYIRLNGVAIVRQTTSEEALAASKQLGESEEAEKLRVLYIRARYDDAEELSGGEVREAEALWGTIREEYEAERRRRREEAACPKPEI